VTASSATPVAMAVGRAATNETFSLF